MPRTVRAVLISSMLWAIALPALAAPRVPQVPVSGTALATFFASQSQTINVNADQVDVQRQAVPPTSNFQILSFGPQASSTAVGIYNAAPLTPALYQILPSGMGAGWFSVAGFRLSPTRMVVNLFDNFSTLQGTTSYLGADPTDFSFYAIGGAGTLYQQDARNAGGAARVLVFNGTGAKAGSTWLAFETSTSGPADYADVIALVNLAFSPVHDAKSSWGRVKSLYR